jgi:hypothetical protein
LDDGVAEFTMLCLKLTRLSPFSAAKLSYTTKKDEGPKDNPGRSLYDP